MQQTILAILALILITFLSVTQARTVQHAYTAMIGDEMEVMASGVALQVMDRISGAAFDENTNTYDSEGYVPVDQSSNLLRIPQLDDPDTESPSQPGNKCAVVGSGGSGYANCNDISDFHNMQWESFSYPIRGNTLTFEVSAYIRYVEDDNPDQPTGNGGRDQSFTKEITVRTRVPLDSLEVATPEVQLRRTVACPANQCAW